MNSQTASTSRLAEESGPPILLTSKVVDDLEHQPQDAEQADAEKQYFKDVQLQSDLESRASIVSNGITRRLLKIGVEEVGVHPIPESQRTDARFFKVYTLWNAMSISVLPCVFWFDV